MKSLIKNHPKKTLLLVSLCFICFILLAFEIVLKNYFPYYTSLKPIIHSEQYYRYGWGNFHKELIYSIDPDTGETYWERVNNKGWRGESYRFKKKKNTFRILILGDSEAYGAVVRKDERYPKVLENLLQKDYNAEVICLSSPGYGTDQLYHAFYNEGRKYKPDLVIVQFNHNDIHDNIYFDILSEACEIDKDTTKIGMKPFYYSLDKNQDLVLNRNPYFVYTSAKNNRIYKFKRNVLQQSEILKRLYGLALSIKKTNYKEYYNYNFGPEHMNYKIAKKRIRNVELVLDNIKYLPLIDSLKTVEDEIISPNSMNDLLLQFPNISSDTIKIIMLLLEDHFFQGFWTEEHYRPSPPDISDKKWTIFFKIMDKILSLTKQNNMDIAIIPCIEQGSINFALERYLISPDSVSLSNISKINEAVEDYAIENHIPFIQPTIPYQRAKYDSHMNKEGNVSIANDIYNWVIKEYAEELTPSKKKN